jgi:ribosomal protein S6--L-glutamate ligase
MDLTLLSRSTAIYSTRRLMEAGSARGHNVRVLDPMRCEMYLGAKAASLFYQRQSLPPAQVVIPRIAQSINAYGLAVLNQFELRGIPVVNPANAIAQSRNKMRCLQLLSAHGIPIPATVMATSAADLKAMVDLVGGVPVMVKVLQGGDRQGVMVCQSLQSMEAALEALLGLGHNLIVQQYVLDRKGRDVRALVVGGEVVAAARRRPKSGRLYRTLARGATLERVELSAEFQRIAVRAAELVGLEVAAVDMLDLTDGPRVFEVNSSPGLKELEQASQKDLAALIVARAERLAERSPARVAPEPRRRRAAARTEAKR